MCGGSPSPSVLEPESTTFVDTPFEGKKRIVRYCRRTGRPHVTRWLGLTGGYVAAIDHRADLGAGQSAASALVRAATSGPLRSRAVADVGEQLSAASKAVQLSFRGSLHESHTSTAIVR